MKNIDYFSNITVLIKNIMGKHLRGIEPFLEEKYINKYQKLMCFPNQRLVFLTFPSARNQL
jgi:hypothetical protein